MFGATIAMLHAELPEAEGLIEEARRLGQSGPGTVDGDVWYLVQLMLLRYQQGRLGELVPALEALYRDFPLLPAIKAGLALALVEAGEPARAQELLSESAARGFQDHPSIDCTWLCYLACYAEVAWSLECTSHAQQLYNSLLPYRELAVACGIVFYGSVEYYLGALAACMGSSPKAHEHLSAALRLHRKWAAPYWEERAAQKLLLAR
jgi:tetratricopeptide (TPR) repeat protein